MNKFPNSSKNVVILARMLFPVLSSQALPQVNEPNSSDSI